MTTKPWADPTAANPSSEWLFVGLFPGQHITVPALRAAVRSLGVDLRAARASAIEALVMEYPPAIVADMLGYSYNTIDGHAAMAGADWASYAHLASGLATRDPGT